MKSCFRARAVTLLLAVTLSASAQTPFYLHPNDRVVFYGDSITQQGLYTGFVETYVLTRFPDLNVRFINSGWSGDWVVGGGGGKIDERLARDVVAEKATVATFMVGMNDAGYQDFDQAFFDVYTKGYQHLVDTVRQALPNLRITLLQPSPFDDVTRPPQYALRDGGYNKVIVRYGQFVREFAQQQKLDVIDMNAPLVAVLEKARVWRGGRVCRLPCRKKSQRMWATHSLPWMRWMTNFFSNKKQQPYRKRTTSN
jgi:lysophospholipase L1-like esterase